MPKKIISLTEGRKRIFDIADEVQTPETHVILTEHGSPKAVIMSAKEFESWQETVSLAVSGSLSPILLKKQQMSQSFYSLEHVLAEEGFIVADTAKQTYDPSGTPRKKRKKKSQATSSRKKKA